MTGRTVTAAEADRRGLVSELVEPDRLDQRALELACAIAELPPLGVQLTKRALQVNTDAAGLEAAMELENRNQVLAHATDEAGRTAQAVTDTDGRTTDGVGLLDRPRVGGATRLGRAVRALGMRADRPDRQGITRPQRSRATGADPAATEDRQGARPVGDPPRPASGRPWIRPGEAGAAQRDSRPVGMCANRFRLAGARFGQQ